MCIAKTSKTAAARVVFGITLAMPLLASSAGDPVSLDDLNQRASLTTIKPVVLDGKRVVSQKDRVEEVANHLCEQFGGRLESLELDFEHPVGEDEMVSYHDGVHLQHHRLGHTEQYTAFESVVCVGLVLKSADPTSTASGDL